MIPYLAAAALVVASAPLSAASARLAGLRPPPLRPGAVAGATFDGVRLVAVVAALPLLVGDPRGDLLVAAVLVAVALGRRPGGEVAAVLLVGAVGALRAGSTGTDAVSGAAAVLGPALTSPVAGVAVAAGLALAGGLLTTVCVVPARRRGGAWRSPRFVPLAVDALVPVAVALLALAVAIGPLAATGAHAALSWAGVRAGALVGILAVAALARRFVPARWLSWVSLLALSCAGAGLLVATVTR